MRASLLVALLTIGLQAQETTRSNPNYVLGAQDVLTVTVFNEPQLSGRFRVENDGQFNYAHGHANCKHGERLISGGLRLHHGSLTAIIGHFQTVASGPIKREWTVTAASDMGGAARADFVVVATCEVR